MKYIGAHVSAAGGVDQAVIRAQWKAGRLSTAVDF
jgi:hypothetical protein